MRPKTKQQGGDWTIETARETYAIRRWGEGYFDINEKGRVCVNPTQGGNGALDLFEIVRSIDAEGLSLPVLVRFVDILEHRVNALRQAFSTASLRYGFGGRYTPVYPIKVNQQRKVVEGILEARGVGLEAGSKPELLAILALLPDGTVVCNGYKDRAYIRLALIGLQMGLDIHIVIEKPSELELIIQESDRMNIKPKLGVRVRLSCIGGNWQNSGGDKAKFGFHATELMRLIERLKRAGMLDRLTLMHFHMGSQIPRLRDIEKALGEAGQFFRELLRQGANIGTVDIGGGLGIDYEGSGSGSDNSTNYRFVEYADAVVRSLTELCDKHQLPHPDILTESGRAMTAHHAVLISNVIDIEPGQGIDEDRSGGEAGAMGADAIRQSYETARLELEAVRTLFQEGATGLSELAEAEQSHATRCRQIRKDIAPGDEILHDILDDINEKLADKIFCNFSLFQSMPDVWGIDQIFPVMPIHRLDEQPNRRGVIQDLTCDSDGRIDRYVEGGCIEKTLPLHEIGFGERYLIGFFLVGAYQEILGDMHNLFGDTHSINIEIDENGYHFAEPIEGDHVGDVLDYVHINVNDLRRAYAKKLARSGLDRHLQESYKNELIAGLTSYTYLEK
ncbi:MAG: biosynthetic arginine decarboxylase [Gammaproteobacteria bacterium]